MINLCGAEWNYIIDFTHVRIVKKIKETFFYTKKHGSFNNQFCNFILIIIIKLITFTEYSEAFPSKFYLTSSFYI